MNEINFFLRSIGDPGVSNFFVARRGLMPREIGNRFDFGAESSSDRVKLDWLAGKCGS
jgi:hypothetical protein